MPIRYPAPLHPGDTIGVTAPSTGVSAALRARYDYCVSQVGARGFKVRNGNCLFDDGVVSAPREARAEELMRMLLDDSIAMVFPPWGGEIAIDLLPLLDFERLARAQPKYLCGYSDLSTLMVPHTLLTGIATLHGSCFMEAPFHIDAPLAPWHLAAAVMPGAAFTQGPSRAYIGTWKDYAVEPEVTKRDLANPTRWRLLGKADGAAGRVQMRGRLIGGCIDTLAMLVGSRFGDVARFAHDYAPDDGLLVYLENCEQTPVALERHLFAMRLAGWFRHANGILLGRPSAPDKQMHNDRVTYTTQDAIDKVLGDLGIPVITGMDIGHVPPQAMLINGALARVTFDNATGEGEIEQALI
jgi:muramoyltetrapeptide carboxypeptidase